MEMLTDSSYYPIGRTDPETQTQIREIARRAREEIDEMSSPATIANKNQRNLSTNVTRRETLPITRYANFFSSIWH